MNGQSAYFASLNRGKESIALNLKKTEDKAVFEKLLASADVLVENYRPGTMEKLGYGWDTLHATYPRLIYAAASGFGHTGPYSKRPAYDMVVQAMGGIMSVTGHPGQPPVRVGTSIGDITAGLFTAIGVNAALLHRCLTGEAIKVDVGMLDCQVAILENAIARYAATGEVAGPIGARHPSITPFAAFEASDGWLVIAAGNDTLFQKMSDAIGAPELAEDPRFATNALRTDNWEPLGDAINAALKARTIDEWLAILDDAGVPSGPINTIDQRARRPACPLAQHGGDRRRPRNRPAADGRQSDQAVGLRRSGDPPSRAEARRRPFARSWTRSPRARSPRRRPLPHRAAE